MFWTTDTVHRPYDGVHGNNIGRVTELDIASWLVLRQIFVRVSLSMIMSYTIRFQIRYLLKIKLYFLQACFTALSRIESNIVTSLFWITICFICLSLTWACLYQTRFDSPR